MTPRHQELASGRWQKFSFVEQMANIGSEVERAINWKEKRNPEYSHKAFIRALELVDLTLAIVIKPSLLKELARIREALVDFFYGSNQFGSTEKAWKAYFFSFNYAARLHH